MQCCLGFALGLGLRPQQQLTGYLDTVNTKQVSAGCWVGRTLR